jgi:MFS-type transporter involved in bile tolerance (Atg22 family)
MASPKEVVFEKPKESSQHLKPLYVRGHINRKLISRMLINDGVAVNLMSYSVFKKLGREDDELVKTNLTLNGVGGATRWRLRVSSLWSSP